LSVGVIHSLMAFAVTAYKMWRRRARDTRADEALRRSMPHASATVLKPRRPSMPNAVLSFRRINPGRSGLTLIELLIAVLVIAALASFVIARTRSVKERTYVAEMTTSMSRAIEANEMYMVRYGQYRREEFLRNAGLLVWPDDVNLLVRFASGTYNRQYGYIVQAFHRKTRTRCWAEIGSAGPSGPIFDGKIRCIPTGPPTGTFGAAHHNPVPGYWGDGS
jgi:prepilin-type N-terminal cleavage/methylation domain-containing protein